MPRGARPGERRGGRVKGKPNRATIEKALLAEREAKRATERGERLGKEYLADFTRVFAGMAATYQPTVEHTPDGKVILRGGDLEQFERWATLAVDAAHKLSPYQSPTMRAVIVAPAPDAGGRRVTEFTLTIFDDERDVIEHKEPKLIDVNSDHNR